MPKDKYRHILIDRILLVLTALLIGVALMGLMVISDRYLLLSREWILFVGGFITYNGTACYLLWGERRHRLHSVSRKFVAILLLQAPMLLAFVLIYSGIIPAPPSMLPYLLGTLLVAPIVVESILFLFRPGS